jgi:circadian clock protein KaiB
VGATVSKIVLQLFIAGRTPRAERAIAALERIRTSAFADVTCEISVIDVLTDPQIAEERKIMATPTLIKIDPPPVRRIIGDLSDVDELLHTLNLPPLRES